MSILVVGHKNPDTDTIVSAIAVADLFTKRGQQAKPIALGEVGAPPKLEILQAQPRWLWFMVWGELYGFWQEREACQALYDSKTTITLEDLPWVGVSKPKIHHPVLK